MERVTSNVIQGLSEAGGEKKGSMYLPGSVLYTDCEKLRINLLEQANRYVRKNCDYEPLLRSMQGLLEVVGYERIPPQHTIGVFFGRCSFEFIEIPQTIKPTIVFSDQFFILPLLAYQGVGPRKEKFWVSKGDHYDLYVGDLFGFEEVEQGAVQRRRDMRNKSANVVEITHPHIKSRAYGKIPHEILQSLNQKVKQVYAQRLDGTKEFLDLKREDLLRYPQGNEKRGEKSVVSKPVLYLSEDLWWSAKGSAPRASTAFLGRSFNRFVCEIIAQGGRIKSVPTNLFPRDKNFAERCQRVSKIEALIPRKKAS